MSPRQYIIILSTGSLLRHALSAFIPNFTGKFTPYSKVNAAYKAFYSWMENQVSHNGHMHRGGAVDHVDGGLPNPEIVFTVT